MSNVDSALDMVVDGMTLGLGSGHAAERFVEALGERVRAGLNVKGVPTSAATALLAQNAGIPLSELDRALPIDITFDGADEVDPALDLIKGYGHALIRERIVAAASRKLVILVGPEKIEEKLVGLLGERGRLPVEVVPFALPLCIQRIGQLGYVAEPERDANGQLLLTDNGNNILNVLVKPLTDPVSLDQAIRDIPGVIGTGLFLGVADVIIIEREGTVEIRRRA